MPSDAIHSCNKNLKQTTLMPQFEFHWEAESEAKLITYYSTCLEKEGHLHHYYRKEKKKCRIGPTASAYHMGKFELT